MELSQAALQPHPDLIVWPEAALPEIIGRNRYTQEAIGNLVQAHPAWMVMGRRRIPARGRARRVRTPMEHFNSRIFGETRRANSLIAYDKAHLMVFGEYMPWWTRHLPFLARLRSAAELSRGEHPTAFEIVRIRTAKFPVSICFEDVFPQEVRRRVLMATRISFLI